VNIVFWDIYRLRIERIFIKYREAALFKTLLHELMTGQRRVHELEFKALVKDTTHEKGKHHGP
jgi:hypothetical protein